MSLHFLLTNDDGIDAPGLESLEAAVAPWGRVTVVAPECEHSGGGHRVTVSRPLRIQQRATNRFCVDGTPADCVRLALTNSEQLGVNSGFDWVIAGINDGGNLGVDVFMSGTVAAAREATWLGCRAIAISQFSRRGLAKNWATTRQFAHLALQRLVHERPAEPSLWNINLPHLEPDPDRRPQVIDCPLEQQHLPVAFQQIEDGRYAYLGSYADRPRAQGSDVDVCFGGCISVTRLS